MNAGGVKIELASARKIRERNKVHYRLAHWPIWIWVFFIAPGPLTFDLFNRGFDRRMALWLGVVLVGNLFALFLLFVPGVNLVAFFLVNGYLLGREFFEFAAMRFRPPEEARLFRAKHVSTVFLAGLCISAFLAVPIVNLLTPLFAAGLMVHLHKLLSRGDPSFRG